MTNLEQVRRKPIKVVLSDGVEREIKFTLNTMAELEERYGSVEEAFKTLEKGSIKSIRYILWAALQHEENPLTEHEVGNIIDINSIGDIMEAINGAMGQDMPQPADNPVPVLKAVSDPN